MFDHTVIGNAYRLKKPIQRASNSECSVYLLHLPPVYIAGQTCVPNENNDNEDAGDESDTGSTNSSHRSANNNLPTKLPDPMSCLALDKVCPSRLREFHASRILLNPSYIYNYIQQTWIQD